MKIILMMAQTLDGKIGKNKSHKTNWTSSEDKKEFIKLTKKAGVIIMGNSTYKTLGFPLKNRLNCILTRNKKDKKDIKGELEYFEDINELLKSLEDRKYKEAILCGGSKINSLFIKNNLISEIYITIEPKIFGNGINLFSDIDLDIDLELIESIKMNNSYILKYKVKK
jgi:dihydrofolate reductase